MENKPKRWTWEEWWRDPFKEDPPSNGINTYFRWGLQLNDPYIEYLEAETEKNYQINRRLANKNSDLEARIAELEKTNASQAMNPAIANYNELQETITKLREILSDTLLFLNEAPFDFSNGVTHEGFDEGNVLGWKSHEQLVSELETTLKKCFGESSGD